MPKCRRCDGNCDPGELIGGVCIECLEEEAQAQKRVDAAVRLINSPCRQMELDFGQEEGNVR